MHAPGPRSGASEAAWALLPHTQPGSPLLTLPLPPPPAAADSHFSLKEGKGCYCREAPGGWWDEVQSQMSDCRRSRWLDEDWGEKKGQGGARQRELPKEFSRRGSIPMIKKKKNGFTCFQDGCYEDSAVRGVRR